MATSPRATPPLDRSQWLLAATALLAVYGVGQIWLVQLSSYHLWVYVGSHEFVAYHDAWWRSIWGPVMVPTSAVFIGSILLLRISPPGVSRRALWVGFALEMLLAAGTAIWWGPLMAHLTAPDGGLLISRYRELMATHWLRVAFVTAYGLLASSMLVKTLRATLEGTA